MPTIFTLDSSISAFAKGNFGLYQDQSISSNLLNYCHPLAEKAIRLLSTQHMDRTEIKDRLMKGLRDYVQLDLRLSHIMLAIAIVVGALINLIFAHGWTVWPVVLAFGVLTYMNEAVSRNGQGVPPYQVYGFFFGAVVVWFVLVMFLSTLNPLILILGVGAILYRIIEAYLRQRERDRLIATRRMEGVCLHCGQPYDPNAVFCDSCGEEPNPDDAILKRVAQIYRSDQDVQHARAVLGKSAKPTTTSTKEQALIARHRTGKTTHASPLPKAAKLGPSRSYKRQG